MADEKVNASALLRTIESLMGTLSKSEQLAARYIVQHPEEVIYLSVAALAENCGVSDPTVVRACQKLGFSGYQDLKITLTQNLGSPADEREEEVLPEDNMQTVITKVFHNAAGALRLTKDIVNAQDLEKAADILINANRIYIFGLGGSNAVAVDLQHKLMRLGMDVRAITDSHLQTIASAYAKAGDVVFAVSHSGSSKSVVDNVRIAKDNGATIISLTNIGRSPLSKLADVSIYTASNEIHYRILALSSRIAELTVIDSLYTYIAYKTGIAGNMKVEKAMEGQKY